MRLRILLKASAGPLRARFLLASPILAAMLSTSANGAGAPSAPVERWTIEQNTRVRMSPSGTVFHLPVRSDKGATAVLHIEPRPLEGSLAPEGMLEESGQSSPVGLVDKFGRTSAFTTTMKCENYLAFSCAVWSIPGGEAVRLFRKNSTLPR